MLPTRRIFLPAACWRWEGEAATSGWNERRPWWGWFREGLLSKYSSPSKGTHFPPSYFSVKWRRTKLPHIIDLTGFWAQLHFCQIWGEPSCGGVCFACRSSPTWRSLSGRAAFTIWVSVWCFWSGQSTFTGIKSMAQVLLYEVPTSSLEQKVEGSWWVPLGYSEVKNQWHVFKTPGDRRKEQERAKVAGSSALSFLWMCKWAKGKFRHLKR